MGTKISALLPREALLPEDILLVTNASESENFQMQADLFKFQLDSLQLNVLYDELSVTEVLVGKAASGVATSAPSWKISKVTGNSPNVIEEFPNGDSSFSYVWDDRNSYTFS